MSVFENYEYWVKMGNFDGSRCEVPFTMNGRSRLLFCDRTPKNTHPRSMFMSFSISGVFGFQVQFAYTPSNYFIIDKPLYKKLRLIGNSTMEDAEAAMVSFELTRERE